MALQVSETALRAVGEQNEHVGTPCDAYKTMALDWAMVHDLRGDTAAMRKAGEKYLPRHEAETPQAWLCRVNATFLFSIYDDAIRKFASKPFEQPTTVYGGDNLHEMLQAIESDTDRNRMSLTDFAATLFEDALDHGLSHFVVDFPNLPGNPAFSGAADSSIERSVGAHPYFVHVPAACVIGWQSEYDDAASRDVLTQVRIKDSRMEADADYKHKQVEHVKVWNRETWELWRKDDEGVKYTLRATGTHTFGEVPLVTLYFRRTGFMTAKPPLLALAWMNVAHWHSTSEQNEALSKARIPFLVETGVPKTELNTPLVLSSSTAHRTSASSSEHHMGWVETNGQALDAGYKDLDRIEARAQILAMQPLIETGAARTATEVGSGERRNHGPLRKCISATNDSLYTGYQFAQKWVERNEELPETFSVSVFKNFDLSSARIEDLNLLDRLEARGAISRETLLVEANRRGLFHDGFDVQKELEQVADEPSSAQPTAAELAAMAEFRDRRAAADADRQTVAQSQTAAA